MSDLAPIFAVSGISFASLQVERSDEETDKLASWGIADLGAGLHDFAETAELISQLDLVITIDTAVAHLAGALAAPVWTMLPFAPDWRWQLDREDCPWYPTMRLFRQPRSGDWASVVKRVAELLVASFPSGAGAGP